MQEKIAQWYELCNQLEYSIPRDWQWDQLPKDFDSKENLELNEEVATLADEIALELVRRKLPFDNLLEFSRNPMHTYEDVHKSAMFEIDRLDLWLRAEEHPLGLRLKGPHLTRGSDSVSLAGLQLELVRIVLEKPGIHQVDVMRLLYPDKPDASIELLENVKKHVRKKLRELSVRISTESGELDFELIEN